MSTLEIIACIIIMVFMIGVGSGPVSGGAEYKTPKRPPKYRGGTFKYNQPTVPPKVGD